MANLPLSLEVFSINFSANDPGSAIILVAAFREKTHMIACVLTDSTIITRQTGGSERLLIWNLDQPDYEVELVPPGPEVRCHFIPRIGRLP
jgi:hypothetical protein